MIIGIGVAGPATALFLQRAGWAVELFEASASPDEYRGSFLNVATNGLDVLRQLGLKSRLESDGHPAPHMVMWSGTGKRLGAVPNGPAGEPARGSVVVRRSWLHRVLRDGVSEAGIPTHFGKRLTHIEEIEDGVRATFADGTTATADILVAADGIGSLARTWIDPSAPAAKYSGLVGLGGFARVDGLAPTPSTQHFVFGHRSFFGYLVRDSGEVYWFANVPSPEPERSAARAVPGEQWLATLRDLHRDDPYPVPQILGSATSDIGGYPIYDLPHVPHWSRGRVVLVGDSAHATSPSAGQGASLALEDAITLAKSLRDEPDVASAFAIYQSMRQPRAEEVVNYARAINAQKRVTKNRVAVAIRDWMMPMFLKKANDDTRNNFIYNHRVEWE
jgi:2-polyprenyl-6-methoxyphenol hydroxylase-like FAD-dependent oxidoreductase